MPAPVPHPCLPAEAIQPGAWSAGIVPTEPVKSSPASFSGGVQSCLLALLERACHPGGSGAPPAAEPCVRAGQHGASPGEDGCSRGGNSRAERRLGCVCCTPSMTPPRSRLPQLRRQSGEHTTARGQARMGLNHSFLYRVSNYRRSQLNTHTLGLSFQGWQQPHNCSVLSGVV